MRTGASEAYARGVASPQMRAVSTAQPASTALGCITGTPLHGAARPACPLDFTQC